MALSAADQQRRQQLRRDMRRRRQALSRADQIAASNRLRRNLSSSLIVRQARRVGVFLAADGELDPLPALLGPDNPSRSLYLPVLPQHVDAVLHFALWKPGEALIPNRYGIGEPPLQQRRLAPLWSLDLVLMPLVAFDRAGTRLGMGGGFYDRALAALSRQPKRPHLYGVAHSFQEVEMLPAAPWDQPLDGVITD
ncbi:MAG: 5-formyltetrahydrofolate cyclo-ligase [Alcanivoracaceae bacterium]|jgi:5-formyltetrahydrofolate cyclo-ligase|nr:5-formyltetrahydrofolate cyclo-ligase [Alcanivoracaceae bacterium]